MTILLEYGQTRKVIKTSPKKETALRHDLNLAGLAGISCIVSGVSTHPIDIVKKGEEKNMDVVQKGENVGEMTGGETVINK